MKFIHIITFLLSVFVSIGAYADGNVIYAPEDVSTTCDTVQCGRSTYAITAAPPAESAATFSAMSASEQTKFLRNRQKMLTNAAKVLHSGRIILGAGAMLKNLMRFVTKPQEARRAPFAELSRDSVNGILTAIDQELWRHAPVIVKSREFGIYSVVNANGGAALVNRGLYGSYGFGFAIGYDTETESSVFEVFRESFRVTHALPVVAQIAVSVQFMLYSSVSNRGDEQNGRYFNPPGPVASFDTNEYMAVGLSQGVGLPPFDTFYSYSADQQRRTLFRISLPTWRRLLNMTKAITCADILVPDDVQ